MVVFRNILYSCIWAANTLLKLSNFQISSLVWTKMNVMLLPVMLLLFGLFQSSPFLSCPDPETDLRKDVGLF